MRVKKFLLEPVRAICSFPSAPSASSADNSLRSDFLSMAALSRIPTNPDDLIVERVLRSTAYAWSVTVDDLRGRRRTEPLASARHSAMLICLRRGLNRTKIDRYFHRREGSSKHDIRRANALMDVDGVFARKVALIETLMEEETINAKGE